MCVALLALSTVMLFYLSSDLEQHYSKAGLVIGGKTGTAAPFTGPDCDFNPSEAG